MDLKDITKDGFNIIFFFDKSLLAEKMDHA